MKSISIVQSQKRKMTIKGRMKKAIQTILLYLVYYPMILPIEKVTDYVKDKRNEYLMSNEHKLKIGMLQEIAVYIASYIAREEDRNGFQAFLVYNSHQDDETNYGNALHLRSFIQFDFYTKHKNSKTKLYYESQKRKYGNAWSEDKFYDGLMKYLESELKKLFKSQTVTFKIKNKWGRNYEYIIIKRY